MILSTVVSLRVICPSMSCAERSASAFSRGRVMSNKEENRGYELKEGNETWALVIIVVLVLGIPTVGILVKLFSE